MLDGGRAHFQLKAIHELARNQNEISSPPQKCSIRLRNVTINSPKKDYRLLEAEGL